MKSILEIDKINKSFQQTMFGEKQQVLKDLSFCVKQNTITGFLGPNGAGKTTTFKVLLNLIFSDSGEIKIFNEPGLTKKNKHRIGFMPERPQFPEYLSAKEFLQYQASFYDKNISSEDISECLDQVGLREAENKRIHSFSKGMLQRLGIAQAIIHDPDFVILDEPMSGLDPYGRFDLMNIILKIHQSGKTVFLSSHLLSDVQKLCHDLVILKSGSCLYNGATQLFMDQFSGEYSVDFTLCGERCIKTFSNRDQAQKFIFDHKEKDFLLHEMKLLNDLEHNFMKFQGER